MKKSDLLMLACTTVCMSRMYSQGVRYSRMLLLATLALKPGASFSALRDRTGLPENCLFYHLKQAVSDGDVIYVSAHEREDPSGAKRSKDKRYFITKQGMDLIAGTFSHAVKEIREWLKEDGTEQ